MRLSVLAMLTLVGVGTSLSGCGGGGDGSVLRSGNSVVLVGPELHGPTVGVGFGGRVVMVGHCLGISGVLTIWPHGTTVTSNDPLTIDVPGVGPLTVGDSVMGGASGSGPGPTSYLPKGIDAVPSGCPTDRVVSFLPDH
jgi:hypothetical protein